MKKSFNPSKARPGLLTLFDVREERKLMSFNPSKARPGLLTFYMGDLADE